jgi:hypothetical protein
LSWRSGAGDNVFKKRLYLKALVTVQRAASIKFLQIVALLIAVALLAPYAGCHIITTPPNQSESIDAEPSTTAEQDTTEGDENPTQGSVNLSEIDSLLER